MRYTLSPFGLTMLQRLEGTVLRVYRDVAGIETVCTGHVVRPEDASWIGDGVTMEECRAMTVKDVAWCLDAIDKLVRVPLAQTHIDALVCLIFNIGPGDVRAPLGMARTGFAGSTVLKRLNAADYRGAGDAFLLWSKATIDGVKRPVLLERRKAERVVFLSAHPPLPATGLNDEWLAVRGTAGVELAEIDADEVLAMVTLVSDQLIAEALVDERAEALAVREAAFVASLKRRP